MDTTSGPKGWTPERLGNLTGKTCPITGANACAGFQAARTLLNKGAKAVMLNRSAEKSQAAVAELKDEFGTGADVSFVRMDLASLSSVPSMAPLAAWNSSAPSARALCIPTPMTNP